MQFFNIGCGVCTYTSEIERELEALRDSLHIVGALFPIYQIPIRTP